MRKNVLLRPTATTLNQIAENYKIHLQTLGHSINGSQTKYRYLLEFLGKIEQQGIIEINNINPKEVQAHYHYLIERPNHNQGGKLSLKSAFSHMRAIQLFFIQLQAQGIIKSNPASVLTFTYPKTNTTRKALTQSQIKQLYQATETHQERALLSLAYGCGLRAAELEAINLEDVNLKERLVIVRKGKGNKRRVIPINHKVVEDLQNYLDHERQSWVQPKAGQQSAFMLHSKGGRMKYYTWNKYLKRIAKRANKQEITTHILRHSIATHLIEQSVEIEQVRKFLGHSQLETTQVYTHIRRRQLQQLER
ncbi:MAG: tyrosine-type recombinase/integrase [Cyclobacteriaceae bacterium]